MYRIFGNDCPRARARGFKELGRRRRLAVAWGGVFLVRLCVPEWVLSIRRIRGWVGAEPIRTRVATCADRRTRPLLPNATPPGNLLARPAGDTRPLLRSSIRMACKGRFLDLSRQPQLRSSPLTTILQWERCFSNWCNGPGISPGHLQLSTLHSPLFTAVCHSTPGCRRRLLRSGRLAGTGTGRSGLCRPSGSRRRRSPRPSVRPRPGRS